MIAFVVGAWVWHLSWSRSNGATMPDEWLYLLSGGTGLHSVRSSASSIRNTCVCSATVRADDDAATSISSAVAGRGGDISQPRRWRRQGTAMMRPWSLISRVLCVVCACCACAPDSAKDDESIHFSVLVYGFMGFVGIRRNRRTLRRKHRKKCPFVKLRPTISGG